MRNLLILILLLIVAWWVQRALAQRRRGRRPDKSSKAARGAERMLACAHCGVHIPESEGVRAESGFFCSDEHRRLGARKQ